jgi:hypothetical protein
LSLGGQPLLLPRGGDAHAQDCPTRDFAQAHEGGAVREGCGPRGAIRNARAEKYFCGQVVDAQLNEEKNSDSNHHADTHGAWLDSATIATARAAVNPRPHDGEERAEAQVRKDLAAHGPKRRIHA